MKVMFLDIDGVLNTKKWRDENPITLGWDGWKAQIDPAKLEILNEYLDSKPRKIVLSSTWRFHWSAEEITLLFKELGFRHKVEDVTPTEVKDRAKAIAAWLNANESGSFIAVDDDDLSVFGELWIKVEDGLEKQHLYGR